jgi:hypothetical protein
MICATLRGTRFASMKLALIGRTSIQTAMSIVQAVRNRLSVLKF